MKLTPRMIGAVIGSIAALSVGGTNLAFAQGDPSTTTPPSTEAPATPAPDNDGDGSRDGAGCDHADGGSSSASTGQTSL